MSLSPGPLWEPHRDSKNSRTSNRGSTRNRRVNLVGKGNDNPQKPDVDGSLRLR